MHPMQAGCSSIPDASHTGCEEDTATATNGCCNVCRAAGGRAPQHSCNQPICRQRHKGNGCVIASAHAGDGWVTQPASCIAVRLLEHLPADCKQGAVLSYLNQDAYRKHDAERSLPAQYQSAPSDVRGPCHNPDPHELHPKPEPQQSPNWPKQRDLTLRIQYQPSGALPSAHSSEPSHAQHTKRETSRCGWLIIQHCQPTCRGAQARHKQAPCWLAKTFDGYSRHECRQLHIAGITTGGVLCTQPLPGHLHGSNLGCLWKLESSLDKINTQLILHQNSSQC
mgnify:CR=1 FL=1